jgi:hypothetical protein
MKTAFSTVRADHSITGTALGEMRVIKPFSSNENGPPDVEKAKYERNRQRSGETCFCPARASTFRQNPPTRVILKERSD